MNLKKHTKLRLIIDLLYIGLIRAIPTKYKYILAKNINNETQKKNVEKIGQRKEKNS